LAKTFVKIEENVLAEAVEESPVGEGGRRQKIADVGIL
jgi:hypothetical protein